MPFLSDRALLKALIVSLSAHVFVLLEGPRLVPVRPDASSAAITVSMQRAGNGTPPAPIRPPEVKVTEKPAIPKNPEQLKAAKALAVQDKPSSSTVLPPSLAPDAQPDAAAATIAPVPARGSASGNDVGSRPGDAPKPGLVAEPTGQEGISAEEVRQYRTSLGISAKRFKRYPALAREREWEGTVEIVLDFRRFRREPDVSVGSSSGRKILDDQALELIRQAVRVTDLPTPLRERDFRVLVSIVFNLNDER